MDTTPESSSPSTTTHRHTNPAPIDRHGTITCDRLAGLLCRDAQEENYDHGPAPTVSNFADPLPSCPRHLAMAHEMLAGMRERQRR